MRIQNTIGAPIAECAAVSPPLENPHAKKEEPANRLLVLLAQCRMAIRLTRP
ncbi:MAG: hypothetical protein ABW002_00825 [Xanthomonas sp.]